MNKGKDFSNDEKTLESTIKETPQRFKRLRKVGRGIKTAIGYIVVTGFALSIAGYCVSTCYQMFPGHEENTTVTRREVRPSIDEWGISTGDVHIIYIDKDKRCLEVRNFYNGPINKGDELKYVCWDFNIRPWKCNVVDEYEVMNKNIEQNEQQNFE